MSTKKTAKMSLTALDGIADVVLRYRPKPKSKPAKKRQRKRRRMEQS